MPAIELAVKAGHIVRDKYELVEVAGRGGMALVWRAVQHGDLGFRRPVAVKQMHQHLAESRIYLDMFAEEARIGSRLHGPNLAEVYDFVAADGHYYLVMEWVDGIDLGSFVAYYREQGERTRWDLVTAIGIGVLRALAAAHEHVSDAGEPVPIVHRDISPHNILITPKGEVKLIDFGLCLAPDREKELTEPGIVKGKMSYLSPEILAGNRPSPAADQFAVGAVLWEALVGRKLFDGASDYEIFKKVREGRIQPLRPLRRDAPKSLVAVIQRALATREYDRFRSTREMARQLGLVLKGAPAPRDLHEVLGRTVVEARESLDMGSRTGEESSAATPLAEIEEELTGKRSGVSAGRTRPPPIPGRPEEKRRGLLHRLGWLGRKKA